MESIAATKHSDHISLLNALQMIHDRFFSTHTIRDLLSMTECQLCSVKTLHSWFLTLCLALPWLFYKN